MSTDCPINRRSFLARTAKLGAAGVLASRLGSLYAADLVAAGKPSWQLGCYTRVFDQFNPGSIFCYSDGKLDPVADAATVGGLVVGMSVKDFLPPKEVLVNIGEGRVDFPAVFARLKQGGFTHGPLIVECLARGTLESVKAHATKARLFLEKLTGQKA